MSFAPLDSFLPRSTTRWTRRGLLIQCGRLAATACGASFAQQLLANAPPADDDGTAADKPSLQFNKNRPANDLRQFTVKLESAGELKLNADGQKVTRRPVQVTAETTFDEILADPLLPVRHYAACDAKLIVGKTPFDSQLDPAHRILAVHREGEQTQIFSPLGPLSRDELELVQIPGTGAPAEELLPDSPTSVGDTWPVPDTALARLLWLDAVSNANVKATLQSLQDNIALITLEGPVSGAVAGIATDIDLSAKLNYDTQRQFVTWLVLGIQENRSIGHAAPGFETKSQVKIAIRPLDASPPLAPEILATLPLEFQPGSALLQYESTEGRFRALLDRRWRLMVNRHDLTVLRLIDRGDLIAQCNLSRLPALAPGKQLPLEELQDDIKNSLGKNFRQFLEASQSVTDEGLRVLRVTVVGEASDLAVQWNYYHVSNDKGQRVALVFTFESNLVDRFAEVDRPLVASLQFLPDPEPTPVSTSAPATATPSKGNSGNSTKPSSPPSAPKTSRKVESIRKTR